jgi:hypothetical protein
MHQRLYISNSADKARLHANLASSEAGELVLDSGAFHSPALAEFLPGGVLDIPPLLVALLAHVR